jgi:type 1 fimbria pilin
MKTWQVVILILALIAITAAAFAQKSGAVPKYDPATEITFKGTVQNVADRQCPVSGGLGSHILLKLSDDKTIEVHLATTKFMQAYELVFNKGDAVEVIGSKVKFEGVDTIFARQVKRGNDTFVFRDKDGSPVW